MFSVFPLMNISLQLSTSDLYFLMDFFLFRIKLTENNSKKNFVVSNTAN